MRIIGGEARGRRLHIPRSAAIRPTSDRIKEAYFNIIGAVGGNSFIDIFAGTGNMGIEALSRGALRVVFVEKDGILAAAIEKNAAAFGFADRCEILKMDFSAAVATLSERPCPYDRIFADPPYGQGYVARILQHPDIGKLMARDSLLTLQHAFREVKDLADSTSLLLTDRRRYGETMLSFFRKRDHGA